MKMLKSLFLATATLATVSACQNKDDASIQAINPNIDLEKQEATIQIVTQKGNAADTATYRLISPIMAAYDPSVAVLEAPSFSDPTMMLSAKEATTFKGDKNDLQKLRALADNFEELTGQNIYQSQIPVFRPHRFGLQKIAPTAQ